MNILLECVSVSPFGNSESFIGWQWIKNLSERGHNVYFLYDSRSKVDIDNFLAELNMGNIYPLAVDVPKFFNKFNGKFHLQFLSITAWQFAAYRKAKKLLKKIDIDVIHHVTLGDFRMIGFLPLLKKPFVFGPVGGTSHS